MQKLANASVPEWHSPPPLTAQQKEILELVKPILMSPLSNWTPSTMDAEQHIAVYWRRHPDESIKSCMFLAMVDLPISVSEAADMINSPASRKEWDKYTLLFEDLGEGVVRTLTHSAMGGLIAGRELIDLRAFENLPDGTHLCGTRSVKDPDNKRYPVSKGYVRGWTYSSGVKISKRGERACTVAMLGCSSVGGFMPKWMAEGATPKALVDICLGMLKKANAIEKERLTGRGRVTAPLKVGQ